MTEEAMCFLGSPNPEQDSHEGQRLGDKKSGHLWDTQVIQGQGRLALLKRTLWDPWARLESLSCRGAWA